LNTFFLNKPHNTVKNAFCAHLITQWNLSHQVIIKITKVEMLLLM